MILSIALKQGVKIDKLTVPMLLGFIVAQRVYESHGLPCVITSGCDGEHAVPNSKHYNGNALDLRLPSRYTTAPNVDDRVTAELKSALNAPSTFDVVLEGDHIHVEFDPKEA